MAMANVRRMVPANALMDSSEIPVQVYLYYLDWFWASLAIESSWVSWVVWVEFSIDWYNMQKIYTLLMIIGKSFFFYPHSNINCVALPCFSASQDKAFAYKTYRQWKTKFLPMQFIDTSHNSVVMFHNLSIFRNYNSVPIQILILCLALTL